MDSPFVTVTVISMYEPFIQQASFEQFDMVGRSPKPRLQQ